MLSTYCVLGAVRGAANLTERGSSALQRASGRSPHPSRGHRPALQTGEPIFVLLYVCPTLAPLNFFPSATHPDNLILGSQGAFCSRSPNAPARLVSKQVHPHLEGQLRPEPPHPAGTSGFPEPRPGCSETRVKGSEKPRVSWGSPPMCPCGDPHLSKQRDGGCAAHRHFGFISLSPNEVTFRGTGG